MTTGKVLFALIIGLQLLCRSQRLGYLALLLERHICIKWLVSANFELLRASNCSSKSIIYLARHKLVALLLGAFD